MRKIKFYRMESGKCSLEGLLAPLNDQQFQKVHFLLGLPQTQEFVPKEYFKKLTATEDIWEVQVKQVIIFSGDLAFFRVKIGLFSIMICQENSKNSKA